MHKYKLLSLMFSLAMISSGIASAKENRVECPFLVGGAIILQLIPNHYPATIPPDIDDSDEGGSGRIEWNNFSRARQLNSAGGPIVAVCTPPSKEGERVPEGINIEIPQDINRCILENINDTPTRFWCE